jgi:protein-S-isoprenylcysteine O-methyltransferase Ste14
MEFQRIRAENIPIPEAEVAGLVIGLLLQGFVGIFSFPTLSFITMTGWTFLGIGFLMGAWAVIEVGDQQISHPEKLIIDGAFCVSRNPMYLGWMGVYIGLGFLLSSPWILILFPLVFAYNHFVDIKKEECFLREKFGVSYEEYCKRVPRYF